jgi:hypothetical protein
MQNNIHSIDDVLTAVVVGGARGLLDAVSGGVGGKVATAIGEKIATKVGTKVAATLGGAVGGAAAAGLYDLATTGSINLGNVALGAAFGAAAGYAGAKFGAKSEPSDCTRPHSFAAGTLVLMADGTTKAIDDIQVGDEVVATDPQTGTTEAQPVTFLHRNQDTDLTDVTVAPPAEEAASESATGEGKGDRSTRGPTIATLHTTQHHPFWDATTQAWTNAADLKPGLSTLLTADGHTLEVLGVDNHTGDQTMRDLTVANTHTYYVVAGGKPVLVHNNNNPLVCPLRAYADLERMAGSTSRTASVLRTPSGLYYFDVSQPRNIAALPISLRRVVLQVGHHGGCAEIGCIEQAMKAGDMVRGGETLAALVRPSSNPNHRLPIAACDACQLLLARLRVDDTYSPGDR